MWIAVDLLINDFADETLANTIFLFLIIFCVEFVFVVIWLNLLSWFAWCLVVGGPAISGFGSDLLMSMNF